MGDFVVFILSHGRASNVVTLKTLERLHYTGKWYIVVDDEDDQEVEYRRLYGEHVVRFCKKDVADRLNTPDLSDDRRCVVYARNACFEIAEKLKIRYFLELDDDYTSFQHRYAEDGKLKIKEVTDLDRLFESMVHFLQDTGALTVALGQGGDLLGGIKSSRWKQQVMRKAMNTFFCDTQKRFDFVGRINEDVNTYTLMGHYGHLILSIVNVIITQKQTQSSAGGMSEMYLDEGTYVKSFYPVIFVPSAVRISGMGETHRRVHHAVRWDRCAPLILNERLKRRDLRS